MLLKHPFPEGDRMNIHKNARLTPHSRAELIRRLREEGQSPKAVAATFGIGEHTVRYDLALWASKTRSTKP